MSEWTGFGDLDLTDVGEEGSRNLPVGSYVCTVAEARVEQNKAKNGRMVVLELVDVAGHGQITERITIQHPNKTAVEIGMRRLKTLLVKGGHPNPDKPGDISTLAGLRIGVFVEPGGTYMKDGEEKQGRNEVAGYGGFFDPKAQQATGPSPNQPDTMAGKPAKSAGAASPDTKASDFDDDIPF